MNLCVKQIYEKFETRKFFARNFFRIKFKSDAIPQRDGIANYSLLKFAPRATVSPPWHGYTNVMGNCLATVVIAKWEGEFQEVISD